MKNCKVIYTNGIRTGVEDQNGQPSKLFKEILNNAHIKNFDEALEVYMQTYSDKIDYSLEKGILIPSESANYANLTEDTNGNFVFYHVGRKGYDTINKGTGQNITTSREEAAALSRVGGVAMYYPSENTGESMISGEVKYMVKVKKERVYDFNRDALNFLDLAEKEFKTKFPNQAFDKNSQLAFVTKVAAENGFDMVVAQWGGTTRAQTVKEMSPQDSQELSGNTIVKDFRQENKLKSNKEKGWETVASQSVRNTLKQIYEKISKAVGNNFSSPLYELSQMGSYTFEDSFAPFKSQEQITDAINNSEISQELKDEYFQTLASQDTIGYSRFEIPVFKGNDSIKDVKEIELKEDGGATFNLDGSNYTNGGLVVPVESINLTQDTLSEQAIVDFIEKHRDKIGSQAVKVGLYKFKDSDKISIDLNIVILAKDREIGLAFGKYAGQFSLFNLDTFLEDKTGADGKNPKTFTPEQFNIIAEKLSQGIDPVPFLEQPSQNFSLENKEPNLKYSLNNEIFSSFKDALRASKEGEQVKVGVNTVNGFKELYSVEANTNPSTFEGMVNNLIKDGLITGETYQDGENTVFRVEGNSQAKKAINSETAKDYVRKYKGVKAVKPLRNGDVVLTDYNAHNSITITTKNGEKQQIKKSELDAMTFKQLSAKFEDPIGILAERELRTSSKATNKTTQQQDIVPENELQLKLLNLLNKMGVTTMSISDYIERFGIKNGAEPSAQALADLTEKIVAFKDGIITTEELSEEVAHFIVAATPQSEKENLLRNIHKTKEWAEFQEIYREVYGAQLKGEALEQAVREEILGKVLANSFIDRFSARENQTQTSIINKLAEAVQKFFQKIADLFTNNFQQELDAYTEQVYSNLMRETLDVNMSNINQKFNMFSIPSSATLSPIYVKASQTLDLLMGQENKLSKNKGSITKEQIKEQRQLLEKIDEEEKLKALSGIAMIADKQLKYLERALNQSRGDAFPLTQEENAVYQTFNSVTLQSLSEMNALLDPKDKSHKKIISEIGNIMSRIAALKGKLGVKENSALKALVRRVAQKHNLTAAQTEEYEKIIKTAMYKDTAWFQANFGSMVQAANPLLNLAGDVIAKTIKDEREVYLPNIKNFINRLTAVNFNPTRLKEFIKDGYIESDIDWKALEDYESEVKAKIYSGVVGKAVTKEEYIALEKEGNLEMDALQTREFNKQFRDESRQWKEQFFIQDYLDKQEALFKDIPIEAVEYHKIDRAQRSDINASVTNEDGRIVHNSNSKADIQELNKKKAQNSHPRDANGDLKRGLREIFNAQTNEYEYVLDNNPSEEAKLAYGLWKINKLNRESFKNAEKKDVEIPQAFLDLLQEGSLEDQIENLFNNAYVGFSDSFWESFGQGSLIQELEEVDSDLAEDIRRQQQRIAGVLKQNRIFNRPSETDANNLTAQERLTIREATESLENLYQEAYKLLPDRERAETEAVTMTNEAYKEELEDTDMNEMEFILKHTTSNGKNNIERLQKAAKKYKEGDISSYKEILTEGMTNEQVDEAVLNYAKSKLLPYYKRTEPQGYSELLTSLKEGNTTMEEFIANPLVKVNPNFSFYDDLSNDNVNPVYLENKRTGRPQIKEGWFTNKDFIEKYGKIKDGVAERNNDVYQAREALLDLQRSTLENLNLTGKHNLYKLPQVGKKGLRQIEDLTKGAWKESLKDLVSFREDEMEFGRGKGLIPQYYVRDLENQSDVTDELLYSYALMAQQSALYKARVENIGDMLSIEQAVLNADYSGKNAQATNTYKMFQSYMDYNFYGIKETFSYQADIFGLKVDVAKIARRFHRWVQTVNLTGLIVPLTSALTGSVMKRLESVIGERINPIAERLANKEFAKTASAAMGESFGFNSNARLNVLGEAYGVYDLTQGRFENSTYSKFTRGVTRWADLTHSMSNFTVNPRVMLAVLMDNRYYDGRIVSLNQYRRLEKEKGQKDEKKIKDEWQKLELFYDDIITENGVRTFNKQAMIQKLGIVGTQEQQEQLLELILDASNESIATRVSTAIQEIDTQIPASEKSVAARHGIANFFLMHSNWILLATQRKFKNRHLNLNTGEMEEGNFVGTYNFLKKLIPNKEQSKSYFKHLKEVWDNSDDVTRKSLHRTTMELAFVNTLLVMSYILSNMMDDDDEKNSWALQFADYMLFRVTNETLSATVALPRQFSETVNNPLKGIDRLYDLKDITDVFNSDVVQTGKYAGETQRYRWIARNMPAIKDYQRVVNIDKEKDLYKFYNQENLPWAIFAHHLLREE